jgi:NADH dehydrogenase (ubiquinone) 1 alpha subcomplex subunit 9
MFFLLIPLCWGTAMGLADLGVTSHKIGGLTIEHLNAYRTGGPSVGTTVGESVHGAGF